MTDPGSTDLAGAAYYAQGDDGSTPGVTGYDAGDKWRAMTHEQRQAVMDAKNAEASRIGRAHEDATRSTRPNGGRGSMMDRRA